MSELNGILIVDKPAGWTSHDVCAFVKKCFKIKKVGHAGTLDPLATGVLVLLLGQSTKQSMVLSAKEKEYAGVFRLGVKTDSHDCQGKVTAEAAWDHVTLEMLRTKALEFTGDILQTPPMVSALKHQGVRLYRLARKGVVVPREPRNVTVHTFEILGKDHDLVSMRACVSKGTYLRTLVNDLGEAIGCYATLTELRRLRSGEFEIKEAVTVEQLKAFTPKEFEDKIIGLRRNPSNHARLQYD